MPLLVKSSKTHERRCDPVSGNSIFICSCQFIFQTARWLCILYMGTNLGFWIFLCYGTIIPTLQSPTNYTARDRFIFLLGVYPANYMDNIFCTEMVHTELCCGVFGVIVFSIPVGQSTLQLCMSPNDARRGRNGGNIGNGIPITDGIGNGRRNNSSISHATP